MKRSTRKGLLIIVMVFSISQFLYIYLYAGRKTVFCVDWHVKHHKYGIIKHSFKVSVLK